MLITLFCWQVLVFLSLLAMCWAAKLGRLEEEPTEVSEHDLIILIKLAL